MLAGGLLLLATLALWDLAARASASETAVAQAQAAVRYALHEMTRVVAAAGAGGLFPTQAVLVEPDPDLPGIAAPGGLYDNVVGGAVTNLAGNAVTVRAGTDVLQVRGVFFSPLLALDAGSGCGACAGAVEVTARAVTDTGHVNDHPARRPRFSRIDEYTRSASAERPMLVLVADAGDLHAPCSGSDPDRQAPPQPAGAVGVLAAPTRLASAGTFGPVDFSDARARELTSEDPRERAAAPAVALPAPARRVGVLDDVVFFVDDSDPWHPALARGVRRGNRFDVVTLADDVEDLQVAYAVDGLYASDGVAADGAVGRLVAAGTEDPDPDVSTRAGGDEWAPNADGERPFRAVELQSADPPPAGFPHHSAGEEHCPRLRAVAISVVAKSRDPEGAYRGPDALGIKTMNSPIETRAYPGPSRPPFRRRLLTVRVSLRNFGPTR